MRRLILTFCLLAALGPPLLGQVGNCPVLSNDDLARPVSIASDACRTIKTKGWRLLTVETRPTSQATAVLTFSGAPADAATVVLGAKTYTYESGALETDGEVDVGASAEASAANLVFAVNLTGTAGTNYASQTTAGGEVTAGAVTGVGIAVGTLTGTTIADTNAVTIAAQVFTFQTVLDEADCHVLLGASDSDSLDNLIAAANGAAGSGTLYAAACTPLATSTAAAGAADTMTLTADTAGVNGIAITTTAALTAGDWGAATLVGGTSTVTFTAITAGTVGNALDSTETLGAGAFAATTFDGAAADPIATVSGVDSSTATAHGWFTSTVTDTEPARTVFTVSEPFYRVSCASGACVVKVVGN